MRWLPLRIMAVTACMTLALSALAHHGGAVEYDQTRTIGPFTGTVTRFEFAYPHPRVHFEVKGEDGAVVEWAALLRPTPAVLRKHGWNRQTMKPGDTLVITLRPHKTVEHFGNTMRLEVNGTLLAENVIALQ